MGVAQLKETTLDTRPESGSILLCPTHVLSPRHPHRSRPLPPDLSRTLAPLARFAAERQSASRSTGLRRQDHPRACRSAVTSLATCRTCRRQLWQASHEHISHRLIAEPPKSAAGGQAIVCDRSCSAVEHYSKFTRCVQRMVAHGRHCVTRSGHGGKPGFPRDLDGEMGDDLRNHTAIDDADFVKTEQLGWLADEVEVLAGIHAKGLRLRCHRIIGT
jgi:hypothetical protein